VASELPSPFEPAVRDAAWHVMGFEIWLERLRRRMRRPEHAGLEQPLVSGVHEALRLTQADGHHSGAAWTEQASRRVRDAYAEAAAAVGLEASPW
jgi:hypothetical protein